MPSDFLVYAAHAVFLGAFVLARLLTKAKMAATATADAGATVATHTTPYARAALGLHFVAFGVMYFALGAAVLPHRVPHYSAWQPYLGALVILAGGALACWAVTSFASWRIRARLDPGHRLATGGPFRHLRHPIYMALNLLALGTAVWVPTPLAWLAFALMWAGSEWRARREETILAAAFGAEYRRYAARTRRFVPGLY